MKRSAVSGAEVNHHQSSKKQSLANTNGRMLQAQDLTAGINEGTPATQIVCHALTAPSHNTLINNQAAKALQELTKNKRLMHERNVHNSQPIDRQKTSSSSSLAQFQNSQSLFDHRAETTGMTYNADSGAVLGRAFHPSLSSSRNLSHLMLSPRYLSVQNQLHLQEVDQKKAEKEQMRLAQVNQVETMIGAALAIQREQQLNSVLLSRSVSLVEHQRNQEVDLLRYKIRIMEQLQNDQQGPNLPVMTFPATTQADAGATTNLLTDMRLSLLQYHSVLNPMYHELGIPTPLQRLNDQLMTASLRPGQQNSILINAASQHILDRIPSRTMLSMAPSIDGSNMYNVSNAAEIAANTLYHSLIPLSLPVLLGRLDTHGSNLSEHQALLRQQIEIFEAEVKDVATHMRGRNKSISLGQVGLRCKHCAHVSVKDRQKGSTYFPSTKSGVYQAAQNMSTTHIANGLCHFMPASVKLQFAIILNKKQNSIVYQKTGSGRQYWMQSVSELGLIDTDNHGIRFIRNWPYDVDTSNADVDGHSRLI